MTSTILQTSPGKNGTTAEAAACKNVVFVMTESHSVQKHCKKTVPTIIPNSCKTIVLGNFSAK